MIFSIRGIALGIAMFAVLFVAVLVFTAWRVIHMTSPAPGGGQSSIDMVSVIAHVNYGPIFWLVLLAMLALGCYIVTPSRPH
jgi:hypothetical protein